MQTGAQKKARQTASQFFFIIPRSPQNPKFFVSDNAEAVRHLIAEGLPFVGHGFSKEPQDRIRELLLCWVVLVVGHALMHDGP